MDNKNRGNFSGKFGFIMAAAGSAVGLGNIWRFPYLAAKNHGGLFLFCYIILALTFGFTLLTTEIAIGRKTGQSPLTAYGALHKKWKGIGVLACIVPIIILPYYCAIGGWVVKYLTVYITGNGAQTTSDGFFTGFITGKTQPIVFTLIFLGITAFIIFRGVTNGIEKLNRVLMPILIVLIAFISIYSLTLSHTDANGVTRTGLEGLKIYVVPDFTSVTPKEFLFILKDALGQLFFSISVAMGIMVAYGSYVKKDVNLLSSINHIEFFDTLVAFLAGLMIIPAVHVFMGTEGMGAGPGLMFVSLPKIFAAMGPFGTFIGGLFFIIVSFAAITSSISIMEAIVSSFMDKFHWSRKKATSIVLIYAIIAGIIVCMGYNYLYFEAKLPNGATAQILDIFDYVSNNVLMPLVALLTCILIGWVVKPETIIEEVTLGGYTFKRRRLYVVMIKIVAPIFLALLLIQSFGVFG